MVVEYDGTELRGWQRQSNGPTVQAHLEDALEKLLGEKTAVTGASRTDSGVHAEGQVACIRTEHIIPCEGLRRALNAELPDSIALRNIDEVPAEFHPRYAATGKHYRYLLWTRRDRSPRWSRFAWHHPRALDVEAMQQAAAAMIGEREFDAFRAVGCAAKNTKRHVRDVSVTRPEPDLLSIDVRGNAFLRNMVRIMTGTLVEVGLGRIAASQIETILADKHRPAAGLTAPPQGLTLVEVQYEYGGRARKPPAGVAVTLLPGQEKA